MSSQDKGKVVNSGEKTHPDSGETAPDSDKQSLWSGRRLQFWLFCVLLGLALVGMALTQATKSGGAIYWLILLWIYALFSLVRAWMLARKHHESIWAVLHLHLLHWLGAIVALHIVFMLEQQDILARDAASDVSLVILALASYLAGLHFERLFVLIGIILALMAVVGAFVEQYTLWLIVIPVSIVAAFLFLKSKLSHRHT